MKKEITQNHNRISKMLHKFWIWSDLHKNRGAITDLDLNTTQYCSQKIGLAFWICGQLKPLDLFKMNFCRITFLLPSACYNWFLNINTKSYPSASKIPSSWFWPLDLTCQGHFWIIIKASNILSKLSHQLKIWYTLFNDFSKEWDHRWSPSLNWSTYRKPTYIKSFNTEP